MAKPQLSARVDDGIHAEVVEYAEEEDISNAEAMRRIIHDGLEYRKRQELRDTQQEIKEEMDAVREIQEDMDEVRDVIITDGGQSITDEVDALRSELDNLQQYLTVSLILATVLYGVLGIFSASLPVALSVGLIPIGVGIVYLARKV